MKLDRRQLMQRKSLARAKKWAALIFIHVINRINFPHIQRQRISNFFIKMVDAQETHGRGRLVNEFILRNFSQRELCHASWELGGRKDVKSRSGLKWGWQWLLGQLPQIIFLENVIRAPSEPARVISYVEINLLSFSPVKFIIHPWSEIKRNSSQKRVRRKDENKWMGSALVSCEVANYAFL